MMKDRETWCATVRKSRTWCRNWTKITKGNLEMNLQMDSKWLFSQIEMQDLLYDYQLSSVTQSCPTLCKPMDCSTPGFPVVTDSQSLLKLMSIESVMPSNHLILCRPLLLLPSVFPSIRVFSSESVLCIRWPSIGVSASASVLPMNIQDWFPLGLSGWISLQFKRLSKVFCNTTVKNHQFSALSFLYSPTLTSIHYYWKNNTFD